jgi:hypothetical protein
MVLAARDSVLSGETVETRPSYMEPVKSGVENLVSGRVGSGG